MDKELLQIIAIGTSVILFMLGGYKWKWLRRYLLPFTLGVISVLGGYNVLKASLMTICLSISLHLPYGEKTPYWIKALTFIAIFGSTLWLGFTYWQIIGAVLALVLFKISNTKWGENIVFWKAWEAITGGLIGITISNLIGR
jgi:hypothetical protein